MRRRHGSTFIRKRRRMTKPKPFPWGKELRYVLECHRQGGNRWIAAGKLYLKQDETYSEWNPSPWARFIWVPSVYVIAWDVKNPGSGEVMFRQKVDSILVQLSMEGKAGEARHQICNYLREYKRLPTPSELRQYILRISTHKQLRRELKEIEGYSALRDSVGDRLLWGLMPRKGIKGVQMKPPYGWKNRIIEAIIYRLGVSAKGRFVLKVETMEPFNPPPKLPRGRPRK